MSQFHDPLEGAIKDLVSEEKDFDYVITTDSQVFHNLGLSSFTSGQLFQFLSANPYSPIAIPMFGEFCEATTAGSAQPGGVEPSNIQRPKGELYSPSETFGGGGCDIGDLGPVAAVQAQASAEGIVQYILNPSPVSNNATDDLQNIIDKTGARFMRYDILTKKYVQENVKSDFSGGTDDRYAKDLMLPVLNNGTKFVEAPTPIHGLIGIAQESNQGLLPVLATDEFEVINAKSRKKMFLRDVTTSLSGCVQWELPFFFDYGCTPNPSGYVKFNLFVFDKFKNKNDDRKVAIAGSPMLVDVPTNAAGLSFAGAVPNTEGTVGQYPAPLEGGINNPNNLTAAELETSYNPNTGKFEAGTKQILARLLTDVGAAALNQVDQDNADALLPTEVAPEGDHYMGNFTVGTALPIGMHNGNPYDYGPYFVGTDCNKNEKLKIRVVNRAPKSFPKGQIVLCSRVDGEWLIMDFGFAIEQDSSVFEAGKWEFMNLIAPYDAYFQDDRNHYENPERAKQTFAGITESRYEAEFRKKYWHDMQGFNGGKGKMKVKITISDGSDGFKTEVATVERTVCGGAFIPGLALLNDVKIEDNYEPSLWGSYRYHQTSSFDFMHYGAGGLRGIPHIGRTNPFYNSLGEEIEGDWHEQPASQVFPFFGCVFNDGYSPSDVSDIQSRQESEDTIINGFSYDPTVSEEVGLVRFVKANPTAARTGSHAIFNSDPEVAGRDLSAMVSNPSRQPMFSRTDGIARQCPADVGTNAKPYSSKGNPLEDISVMMKHVNIHGGTDLLPGGVANMLQDSQGFAIDGINNTALHGYRQTKPRQLRWQWMGINPAANEDPMSIDNHDNLWNMEPINTSKVCFMPLYLEHLASFDYTLSANWLKSQGAINNGGTWNFPGVDDLGKKQNRALLHANFDDLWFDGCYVYLFGGTNKYKAGTGVTDSLTDVSPAAPMTGSTTSDRYLFPGHFIKRGERNRKIWQQYPGGGDLLWNDPYVTLQNAYFIREMFSQEFQDRYDEIMHHLSGGKRTAFENGPWPVDNLGNYLGGGCEGGFPWICGDTGEEFCGRPTMAPEPGLFMPCSMHCTHCQEPINEQNKLPDGENCQDWEKEDACCNTNSPHYPGTHTYCYEAGATCMNDGQERPPNDPDSLGCLEEWENILINNSDLFENPELDDLLNEMDRDGWNKAKAAATNYGSRGVPYSVFTKHAKKYGNIPDKAFSFAGEGGNAVGIISAKCTVKCGGFEIGANTQNFIGVTEQPTKVHVSAGTQTAAIGRWGVNSETISGMATTNMYAKVYDAWPSQQTIHDPRYFATMHFNPGALFSAPSGAQVGSVADPSGVNGPACMWVDQPETSVDFREPTLYGDIFQSDTSDFVNPPRAFAGFKIPIPRSSEVMNFAPSVFARGVEDTSDIRDSIRDDQQYWQVNTSRRGQLLPYKYKQRTISISTNDDAHFIAASGTGYKKDDHFNVKGGAGGGARVTVMTVNEDRDEGPLGAIKTIRVGHGVSVGHKDTELYTGEGFVPTDFITKDDLVKIKDPQKRLTMEMAPKLGVEPITNLKGVPNEGIGAVIYLLYGNVIEKEKEDLGPTKQQSTTRISSNSNNGLEGNLEGRTATTRLTIPQPNDTKFYDVFFHFHNDVGHTIAVDGYTNDPIMGKMQFIDLELVGLL
ncbi:MAG: hypothetical protein CMA37_03725 [Euryarchaeota archaeon]|nr:hypothetical protein [Euryarchaeota archaeon]